MISAEIAGTCLIDYLCGAVSEHPPLTTQMCDWLSSAEWSDVKIICGNRSFGAHKAVLASVSTFLKDIFLSCLVDEVPIYIILPEFDVQAMSSVLYYVYNGEVTIEKRKLRLFMDIIHAMQIYIDCQYLTEFNKVEKEKKYFSFNHGTDLSMKRVFTLAMKNENNQKIVNIKKIKDTQSVILKCEQSESDFDDNKIRCQNESEAGKARLGNLKSPYCDRQRNSFLRDLFIETYPRNGNINGRSEAVLAISNVCYQSPTSVLSANANGNNLDVNDASPTMCNNSTGNVLHSQNVHLNRQQTSDGIRITNLRDAKYSTPITNTSFHCTQTLDFAKNNRIDGIHAMSSINSLSSLLPVTNSRSLETSHTFVTENYNQLENIQNSSQRKTANNSSKVIFNQVLQGPWSSRKPNNYRPFRKKVNKDHSQDSKVEAPTTLNDSNNNINQSTTSAPEAESIPDEDKVPVESTLSKLNTDSYKCSFCNQVFTNSEILELHLRRHSTNARYTCSDCGKTFSQLRNFKYHMSIHRGTREFAATCTVCGKYFNDRGYLSSHMKIHRNRKEYKCSQCPKSFNQRVAYNMHVRIHTGVKPHVCEECGKAFSRKMLLKQHQRTHSGERPYACTHCDKRFADRSNMTLHLRLHTGVKPFSCSVCPKSFTKKHHLKSHLNFHTGSKPYSCPRCNLSFTQSSNMRTHYKKCSAQEKAVETETNNT